MPVSGKEMLKKYRAAGWSVVGTKGSHVKVGKGNMRETIPMHKELRKGLEQMLRKRLREVGE